MLKNKILLITAALIFFTINLYSSPQKTQKVRLKRGSEVGVVQKKVFQKNFRFEFSPVMFGKIINDPFIDSYLIGSSLGFHISDTIGFEGFYMFSSSTDNDLNRVLQNEYGKVVAAGKTKSTYGGNFLFTPFYGKFSLFSKFIIHLDTFFSLGYGTTNTDLAEAPTYYIGIGQRYFINKWFTFRLDVKNFIHKEDRVEFEINKKNILVTFGTSMFFPNRFKR